MRKKILIENLSENLNEVLPKILIFDEVLDEVIDSQWGSWLLIIESDIVCSGSI